MTETAAPPTADLLVIYPEGLIHIEPRDRRGIPEMAADHVPDTASQGHGALRWWFPDRFTPDLAPNPIATAVTASLGYPYDWRGPLGISAEATGPGDDDRHGPLGRGPAEGDDWPPIPSAALRAMLGAILGAGLLFAEEAAHTLAELADRAEALGH